MGLFLLRLFGLTVPLWANHLVQGKMLREGIGFGREDSSRSLTFHESKRRLHKPHLHSKDKAPLKPYTSAASLFNSNRFYHSVQLNSWLRICLRDQRNPYPLHEWLACLTITPPRFHCTMRAGLGIWHEKTASPEGKAAKLNSCWKRDLVARAAHFVRAALHCLERETLR